MTFAFSATFRALGLLLPCLLLSACSFNELAFREAKSLINSGQVDAGMAKIEKLIEENPGSAEYKAFKLRQQELRVNRLLVRAQTALVNEDFNTAAAAYSEALAIDRQNPRAQSGFKTVEDARRHLGLVQQAEARAANEPDVALGLLRSVLSEVPSHPAALRLKRRIDGEQHQVQLTPPLLSAAFKKPVTLQFRDAAISEVFQALAQVAGLSFVFDKDVISNSKVTLFANNMTVEDALTILLNTSQLEKKVLGESALLIYPNNPAKKADYQENVIKSFYIGNADPKQTMNLVKTMARTRDVFIDEKLGLLTVRDTLDNIRIIEKLIAAQDLAEPEVMLEVEVLEVATSRLMNLGIQYPEKLSLTPFSTSLAGGTTIVQGSAGTGNIQQDNNYVRGITTLKEMGHLTANKVLASIGDPGVVLNLREQDGLTNLLANPRIRVKSREKAKVRIGDKLPVITTTTASTGVTSESVQYLDVGLALDVEPVVHPDNQISIKLALEVSNQLDTVTSKSGLVTYKIGTRRAETSLRLKDGETQILGGLIRSEERNSAAKLPGLGDLPVLGRLFGANSDNVDKTEIVLLVTPRILRRTELPPVHITEFAAGSDNYSSVSPLRLQASAKLSIKPPVGGAVQAPPPNNQGAINPANGQPIAPPADESIIVTFTLDAPPRVAVAQPIDLRILSLLKKDVKLLNLEIDFDANKLEYVGAKVGGLMGSSGGTPQLEAKAESPGRLRLIIQNAGGAKGSGDLATLTFKGKQAAAEPAMVGFGGIFANDMSGNQVTIMSPDPRPIIVSP